MLPIDHRPRSVSELIDTAIALLRRDYARYCLIVLAIAVPWQVVRLAVVRGADFGRGANADLGALGTSLAIAILFYALMESSLALAVSRSYEGRAFAVREALGHGLRRWFAVLASLLLKYAIIIAIASLATIVVTVLGMVLLFATGSEPTETNPLFIATLVVALALAVLAILPAVGRYAAVPITAAIEPVGPLRAMRRSRELTQGLWRHAVGAAALAWVVVGVPSIALSWVATLFNQQFVEQLVEIVTTVLLTPLYVAAVTALYYDLRIRKEGFDLELLASQLAPTEASAALPSPSSAPAP